MSSQNEEVQMIKNWIKFSKINQNIPSQSDIKTQTKPNAFCLQILRIDNLIQKSQGNWLLKFAANLYNKKTKEIFGKTYNSEHLPIQFQGNEYNHNGVEIFFYSKDIASGECEIIIEIFIFLTEENSNIIQEKYILGYSELLINPQQVNSIISSPIYNGNGKTLLYPAATQIQSTNFILQTQLVSFDFPSIYTLIPDSTLIGTGDNIPGLVSIMIDYQQEWEIEQYHILTLEQIDIEVTDKLEEYIQGIMQNLFQNKYSINAKNQNEIKIISRKIIIGQHNGYQYNCLNEQELNVKNKGNGEILHCDRLVLQPVFNSNFKDSRKGFPTMLVFVLEFDIEFNAGKIKQNEKLVISWLPLPMSETPYFTFQQEMIKGPGRIPGFANLMDLSKISTKIKLSCHANLEIDSKQQKRKFIVQSNVQLPKQIQKQVLENIPSNSSDKQLNQHEVQQLVPQTQNIIKEENEDQENDHDTEKQKTQNDENMNDPNQDNDEIDKKIAGITQLLSNLQQQQQVVVQPSGNDYSIHLEYERQLMELKLKEEEYRQSIFELKQQQEMAQQQANEQFDELKKLVLKIHEDNANTKPTNQDQDKIPKILQLFNDNMLIDQDILDKWKLNDNVIQVPRSMPASATKDNQSFIITNREQTMPRSDIALLSTLGFQGLMENIISSKSENNIAQIELDDIYKKNKITITLLTFKPSLSMIDNSQDNYSEEIVIPLKLKFTLQFYDFPIVITPICVFENIEDKKTLNAVIQAKHPLVIIQEKFSGDKQVTYQFIIDPSVNHQPESHEYFVEYLLKKHALIDIYDSESNLLYGSVRVPLRDIMRQQKREIKAIKEYDIINKDLNKSKGTLGVLLYNIGDNPAHQMTVSLQNSKGISNRKKVISTTPIDNSQIQIMTASSLIVDQNERINERIRRLKQGQNLPNLSSIQNDKQQSQMILISNIREQKKQKYIKDVLSDHLNDSKNINVYFGRLAIIPFQFSNPFNRSTTFKLRIQDDMEFITKNEIDLIYDSAEWKLICDNYQYTHPPDYHSIAQIKDKFTFLLNQDENITLLFKFITYRTPADHNSHNTITHRTIPVFITEKDSETIVGGLKINITPYPTPIDYKFRYFLRDNRQVQLQFPTLFHDGSNIKPTLICTDKQIALVFSGQLEISLSTRVGQIGTINRFNILAYSNEYLHQLYCNWAIELYSLAGVDLSIPLGQTLSSKLTITTDVQRIVKLYSSHPLMVWFQNPYDRQFTIQEGRINMIDVQVRTFCEKQVKVLINCIDTGTKELFYTWILNVQPKDCVITKVYEIKVESNLVEKVFNFVYENKTQIKNTFYFTSLNPDVIQINSPSVFIQNGGKADISITVMRQQQVSQVDVKLFIEDQSKMNVDCLLLKIQFQ